MYFTHLPKAFCTRSCQGRWNKWHKTPNVQCSRCQVPFWVKSNRAPGTTSEPNRYFCSRQCTDSAQRGWTPPKVLARDSKQQTRPRTSAGYVKPDRENRKLFVTEHQRIVCEHFGIEKMPEGWNIHHRDCRKDNNCIDNLVILSPENHRWLHNEAGSGLMFAYCRGEISEEQIRRWYEQPDRILTLLRLKLIDQKIEDFPSL